MLKKLSTQRGGSPASRWVAVCLLLGTTLGCFAHGDLFLRIKDLTERIEAAGAAAAPLYLERGELKRDHGDFSGAEEDYAAAAKLAPDMPEIELYRGRVLADTGKLQEALTVFNKVAVRMPKNFEVFIDRARLKARLEDSEGSVADYRRGVELASEPEPVFYHELAQVLVTQGDVAGALAALDSGIGKTGPELSLQAYGLELELGRGNTNAAIVRLNGIIENAHRQEAWLAQKGDLLSALGKRAAARQAYLESISAIGKLPPRLQQTPAMVALRARVEAALGKPEAK